MRSRKLKDVVAACCLAISIGGCGTIPIKQYYVLNYLPSSIRERATSTPYPCTIRLKEFGIEEAYNRLQIVYRQSPFELRYYFYRQWAVKPTRMVTDLAQKQLLSANLVSNVVLRYEEGPKPDYELSGSIEALEEYDSKELWFAHLALRLTLIRLQDGATIYFKRFDVRKQVYQHEPEYVIKAMSSLLEYVLIQAIHDLDIRFAKEYGTAPKADTTAGAQAVKDSSIIPAATGSEAEEPR